MRDKAYLSLLFALIILFSGATIWQFTYFGKSIKETNLPKFNIEIPDLKISSQSENEIQKKEFISQDGKLKLNYSSDWVPLSDLEAFNKELVKEGAEVLLFAQKFDLEKSFFAFLIAQKINFEEEKNISEIIELLQEKTKEKGMEMEVIKTEAENNQAVLDLKYKREKQTIFLAKEKIITDRNEVYLIDAASPEKDWPSLEKEAEEIISSIQFSE